MMDTTLTNNRFRLLYHAPHDYIPTVWEGETEWEFQDQLDWLHENGIEFESEEWYEE